MNVNRANYMEKLVALNRVSKTVKGGRVMKFSALMVVGDGNGKVGLRPWQGCRSSRSDPQGPGGCQEEHGHRDPVTAPPFLTRSSVSSARAACCMKPAAPGTGVIAGGAVRAVVEAAGIKDIRTKCLRSNNANNVVGAAFEGLKAMRSPEQVAKIRGKSVEEIVG